MFDPDSGAMLLTAEEAARYLHYHPVSIRRLVLKGRLRPNYRVGRALLFLRDELDRFKRGGAPLAPGSTPQGTMRATVSLRHKGKESVLNRLETFRLEDVPGIRAQIRAKHGDVPFLISAESPDGSSYELSFHPPRGRSNSILKI